MNEDEVRRSMVDHHRGESQNLITGAEANLLKFKEMIGAQSPAEKTRWDEIKKTFQRNLLARGGEHSDPAGRIVAQLADFRGSLSSIGEAIERQLSRPPTPLSLDLGPLSQSRESLRTTVEQRLNAPATTASTPSAASRPDRNGVGTQLAEGLNALREDLSRAITAAHSGTMAEKVESLSHELEMIHSTMATLKDLAVQQRDHLRSAQDLLAARAKQGTVEIELTQEMLTNERAFLDKFHEALERKEGPAAPPDMHLPGPPPLPGENSASAARLGFRHRFRAAFLRRYAAAGHDVQSVLTAAVRNGCVSVDRAGRSARRRSALHHRQRLRPPGSGGWQRLEEKRP
jgi:hypothetical protein